MITRIRDNPDIVYEQLIMPVVFKPRSIFGFPSITALTKHIGINDGTVRSRIKQNPNITLKELAKPAKKGNNQW